MISRAEIKKNAKKSVLSNYGSSVAASLAAAACILVQYIVLKGLLLVINSDWMLLFGIIPGLLLLPLHVGISGFFLKIYCDESGSSVKQVFTIGFKTNYKRNLAGMFLRAFKLFLWSLIGLVPLYYGLVLNLMSSFQGNPMVVEQTGLNDITYVLFFGTIIISVAGFIPYIMRAISYSMTPYILAEDQDILPLKALKLSESMTNGHRKEIFMMYLSFTGWIILTAITLGILGVFWTKPYMTASFAGLYEDLHDKLSISEWRNNNEK